MKSRSKEDTIIQNLKDAGCDCETITAFMKELREGRIDEGLELLSVYRRSLLDALHKEQRQIDCLDYLASVPQFDTMHPGVSLGANFNDRNSSHPYRN